MASEVSIKGLGIKYGLITAGVCVVYFLVIRETGLINNTWLRFFNYAIIAGGLYPAFVELRKRSEGNSVSYMQCIGLGFFMVLVSAVGFAFFIGIYSSFIDTGFVNIIKPDLPYYRGKLNGLILGVYICSETILFGIIFLLIVLQLFRRNTFSTKEPEEKPIHRG